MEHRYVIAYYGEKYTDVYSSPLGWHEQYIGDGIVHESDPIVAFGGDETEMIQHYAPSSVAWNYAKIEERYYPSDMLRND
jgi:hypothetical protein